MHHTAGSSSPVRLPAHPCRIPGGVATPLLAVLGGSLLLTSCSDSDAVSRAIRDKTTSPVTGRILVDGQPAEKLLVNCFNAEDKQQPPVRSLGLTGEDGILAFSTFEAADGVPPGEYVLTFEWRDWDDYWSRHEGPDKLGGRYSDPEKSEYRLIVKNGQTTYLETIELVTK